MFNAIINARKRLKGHAQAVALVGKMLKIQTTIVMPNNAPATKLAATRGYGANVIVVAIRHQLEAGYEANNE